MMVNTTMSLKIDTVVNLLWDFYDYFHGSDKDYLLIFLYVSTILVDVIANIFVIIMVCKYHLKSVTNYYVINLSVADLLVAIICMPMTISQEISMSWNNEFLCKLTSYLQCVSVTASIYTIMAMSIDRYLAIRNPMILRCICSHRNIILVIVAIWLTSMGFFIIIYEAVRFQNPMKEIINNMDLLMTSKNFSRNTISPLPPDFYMCMEDFVSIGIRQDIFGSVYFLFSTAIPCFVVLLAYSMIGFTLWSKKPPFDCENRESASSRQGFRLRNDRKRVALILLFLAILFALCWLPYSIVRYLMDLEFDDINLSTTSNMTKYFLFLGHANSALNPVVYCWMTRGFRQNLARALHCLSSNLSQHNSSRKNAMTTSDDEQHIPIYLERLSRMRRHGILQQQKWLASYRNSIDSPHRHKDIELRNFCDIPSVQIDPLKNDDKSDRQQNKYINELDTSQPESNTLCTTDGRS